MKEENRTDEEVQAILTNSELDDNAKTQAIKDLVGKSFVPTAKFNAEKQNTKAQLDAYNTLKAEYDTFKESKMTEEEKKAEQDRLKEERYQKANLAMSRMCAETVFAKAGFKEEDYSEILDNIVTEDPEKTKGDAEAICNLMSKQKKAIEKNITDKIAKGIGKPPAGSDTTYKNDDELEKYKEALKNAKEKNDFAKEAYYTRLIQQAEREEDNKEE